MNSKPEEFKEPRPDVTITQDFPLALVAFHHKMYAKGYCSVGAQSIRLSWMAQLQAWCEDLGLEITDRWEYNFTNPRGEKETAWAIKIVNPKREKKR